MKKLLKSKPVWIILVIVILWSLYRLLSVKEGALVYTVHKSIFISDVKVDGTVKSRDSYIIKAPANIWRNTRIVRMAAEGAMVKKGDLLIQFDTAEFMQKVREAENNVETNEANLASTIAKNKSAMSDIESNIKLETYSLEQSRLRAKNAIYESENKRKEIEFGLKKAEISFNQLVERKKTTIKIQQASIRQAQLQVDQTRIKLKRANDDLKKLTILSPISGMVVYKEVWEGNGMRKVHVGFSPYRSQALLEIPGESKMKVNVNVDETDISRIKQDQKVHITLDAIPDTVFDGQIKKIAALANRQRDTKKNVFAVEIFFDSEVEGLKPGMSAHTQIIVDEIPNVLSIPVEAVYNKGGKSWVLDSGGDRIDIVTGKSNSDFVVVEKGLKEDDTIRLMSDALPESSPKKKKKKSGGNGSGVVIMM